MDESILAINGLSVPMLTELSYRSNLGISLKRTLRHFERAALMEELSRMTQWLDMQSALERVALDYRIKSSASISAKYERYVHSDRQMREVFNDILGFRAACDDYDEVLALKSAAFSIADMSHGKAQDDGYRGVHVYFQADAAYYPIEIQFNRLYDRQLNNWLHSYLYKKNYPDCVGAQLRQRYESGEIHDEKDFEEALEDVLSRGERRQ